MNGTEQSTRIEQTIEIETTPARVFGVLTDPNNIVRYAGGIEGAEVIERPIEGFAGAKLELVTKGGNILKATVLRADAACIQVRDERGIVASWEIEDIGGGKVRIRNIIEGPIPTRKANALRYDADVKFQALQHILDDEDPITGSG